MRSLELYQRTVDRLEAERRLTEEKVERERSLLDKANQGVETTVEAQKILQGIAATLQQQAHRRIADVVTRCLEAVFEDEAYEFKINFEEKRGKTEARLLFVRNGLEIDPLSSSGGGAIDVAAFALRLACLMLARPVKRRLLVLDEPLRFLSASYRPRVRALIEQLAEEFDVQFILVTHIQDLVMGKVVEIERC